MADLTLNDRLQPALLDRLLDDERTVALIRIVVEKAALERLELPLPALLDILRSQGLTLQDPDRLDRYGLDRHASNDHGLDPLGALDGQQPDLLELHFIASRAQASPANLRALIIRPPGAPEGVTLQSFATLDSAAIANPELEPAERRMLSKSRLRECVHRDLGWLFNSLSLDSSQDLAAFPEVASSVLNFGLPSFAGRMTSSIDPVRAAEQLRRAIELFEPRLRSVRVRPREASEAVPALSGMREGQQEREATLEFTIEAELWGQPTFQHLELHTKIDTMSGDVSVTEARAG